MSNLTRPDPRSNPTLSWRRSDLALASQLSDTGSSGGSLDSLPSPSRVGSGESGWGHSPDALQLPPPWMEGQWANHWSLYNDWRESWTLKSYSKLSLEWKIKWCYPSKREFWSIPPRFSLFIWAFRQTFQSIWAVRSVIHFCMDSVFKISIITICSKIFLCQMCLLTSPSPQYKHWLCFASLKNVCLRSLQNLFPACSQWRCARSLIVTTTLQRHWR